MASAHKGGVAWGMVSLFRLEVESGELHRESFFELSSKIAGFYAFYCEKLLVAGNWDQKSTPWGLKM